MRRIAFLTASCMFEGNPETRGDAYEHALEFTALSAACRTRLMALEEQIWTEDFDLEAYDAYVVGTCWDYQDKPEAFLDLLERIDAVRPLFNPLAALKWNMRKTYLRELEAGGAVIVPTIWADQADADSIAAAFDRLGAEDVVVKGVVGAGGLRQVRLKRGEALPGAEALPLGAAMIQPFLPAAQEEGEYSFLFFDGVFSHCVLKRPAKGEYRVQSLFGGTEVDHDPSTEDLALAKRVLSAVKHDLLYARIDMMRLPDGRLAVMELEILEPYLYPEQGRFMGAHFAAALDRRLS